VTGFKCPLINSNNGTTLKRDSRTAVGVVFMAPVTISSACLWRESSLAWLVQFFALCHHTIDPYDTQPMDPEFARHRNDLLRVLDDLNEAAENLESLDNQINLRRMAIDKIIADKKKAKRILANRIFLRHGITMPVESEYSIF
jgi:acyl-CoA thioesterase